MRAAAGDLDRSLCVFAALAAVFFTLRHDTAASRVGTFLLFSLRHGEYPLW